MHYSKFLIDYFWTKSKSVKDLLRDESDSTPSHQEKKMMPKIKIRHYLLFNHLVLKNHNHFASNSI